MVLILLPMTAPPNRLREIRHASGLTLEGLADRIDQATGEPTTSVTLSRLERGDRELTTTWMHRLAKALNCSPSAFLSDSGSTVTTLPLVGYVGAAAMVYHNAKAGPWGEFGTVEVTLGVQEGYVALQVEGDALSPRYEDGEILYFLRTDSFDPEECEGRYCAVQLRGGAGYVRRVERAGKKINLTFLDLDPIVNADIEWAAPIKGTRSAN